MRNKELKRKIEEHLKSLKEKICSGESYEKIKEEQKILNKLLEEYLEGKQ